MTTNHQLEIPESLRAKLLEFRRRVWRLKMFEAFAAAMIGVLVGFLLTYGLDRFFDTPMLLRGLIFVGALVSCALVPLALERWVWRRRRLDQLARLLSQTHPAAGDQLLGVLELSEDAAEQSRSPVLVQAAITQVADRCLAAGPQRRDSQSATRPASSGSAGVPGCRRGLSVDRDRGRRQERMGQIPGPLGRHASIYLCRDRAASRSDGRASW